MNNPAITFAGLFAFNKACYAMPALGFRTNIHPITSARGFGVWILTIGGTLCCYAASIVDQSRHFALPLFLGTGMLFGAFTIHFNYQNFELHSDWQQYRYFTSILWLRIGQWRRLPRVTGVVMKYFSETPISRGRGWQVQNPLAYCIVMLSTEAANHQGIIVHKFPYRHRDEALRLTMQLADFFNVEPLLFEPH
ncbi:hypothetical protein [Hymenobacter properus]|uniref:Uncharacterized protein n=1 Tax=Hymenobacter properus TaxID=2791026 RepID=A0A931BHL0_9BACT|nr:hypothetical protein [Hymenobacter properus]MBF9144099.1 hypothetical protein [Hymenobacter properus]MBR7722915.1 hypothetical protein [Microvirga sp. SRT04]